MDQFLFIFGWLPLKTYFYPFAVSWNIFLEFSIIYLTNYPLTCFCLFLQILPSPPPRLFGFFKAHYLLFLLTFGFLSLWGSGIFFLFKIQKKTFWFLPTPQIFSASNSLLYNCLIFFPQLIEINVKIGVEEILLAACLLNSKNATSHSPCFGWLSEFQGISLGRQTCGLKPVNLRRGEAIP